MQSFFKKIGYSDYSIGQLLLLLNRFKKKIFFVSFVSFILPFLEIGLFSLIYLVLSPDNYNNVIELINSISIIDINDQSFLILIFILSFLLLFIMTVIRYLYAKASGFIALNIYMYSIDSIIESYLYSSSKNLNKFSNEKIINAVVNEASGFGNTIVEILRLLLLGISSLVYFTVAATISLPLFLIALMISLISFYISNVFFRRAAEISQNKINATTELLGYLDDLTKGYKSIKIEGLENKIYNYLDTKISKSQIWRTDRVINEEGIIIVNQILLFLTLLLVVIFGIFFLSLEVSLLMVFAIIMVRMKAFMSSIINSFLKIKKLLPSVNSVADILQKLNQGKYVPDQHPEVLINTPLIEFNGVSFEYNENNLILDEINLVISPGDKVLITGDSGSGKSTLLMLLMGIVQPTKGNVMINENIVTNESFYKFRSNFSYASPDSYLLKGSIKDNIYFHDEAHQQDVMKLSLLDDLIKKSADGVNINIGNNGDLLSLGERQRVILARLLSQKSSIVVLDEATSNLNIEFENTILNNLEKVSGLESIIIIVAHKMPKNFKPNRTLLVKNRSLIEQ